MDENNLNEINLVYEEKFKSVRVKITTPTNIFKDESVKIPLFSEKFKFYNGKEKDGADLSRECFSTKFDENNKFLEDINSFDLWDITDEFLLNNDRYGLDKIAKKGLMVNMGTRIFLFETGFKFLKKFTDPNVYLDDKNGKQPSIPCHSSGFKNEELNELIENKSSKVLFEIDTNNIYDFKDGSNKDQINKQIIIQFNCNAENDINYIFDFSFNIIFKKKEFKKNKKAAIDFGSTSTCIAIRESDENNITEPKFITLVQNKKNEFECDTSLFMINKNLLYKKDNYSWIKTIDTKNKIPNFPISKEVKIKDTNAYFAVGSDVRKFLSKDSKDVIESNAAILNIKYEPYKNYLKLKPDNKKFDFLNSNMELDITYETRNTGDSFNPIEFYGYLIGRAINNPYDGLCSKFYFTKPVCFPENVVNTIEKSLTKGLERTFNTDDENPKINFKEYEPVAFVYSIIDKFGIEKTEGPFCVFDLGGGTLDYTAGFIKFDKKIIIELIGVGGNPDIAGEKLINFISDSAVCNHLLSKIDENEINTLLDYLKNNYYFEPEFVKWKLDKENDTKDTNIKNKIIKNLNWEKPISNSLKNRLDKLSRQLFIIGTISNEDSASVEIELEEKGNKNETKKEIININQQDLDIVKDIIDDLVTDFKVWVDNCFKCYEEENEENASVATKDIHVYFAGNTTKHRFVTTAFTNNFGDKNITKEFPKESNNKTLTPKTACAYGLAKSLDSNYSIIPIGKHRLKYSIYNSNQTKIMTALKEYKDFILFEENMKIDDCISIRYTFSSQEKPDPAHVRDRQYFLEINEENKENEIQYNIFIRASENDLSTVEIVIAPNTVNDIEIDEKNSIKSKDIKLTSIQIKLEERNE